MISSRYPFWVALWLLLRYEFSDAARRTGSANCRTCKSCRYCAYCAKNGRACSVCSNSTSMISTQSTMTRLPLESLSSLTSGSGGRFEPGKSVVMSAIYANVTVYKDEEDDVILDDLKHS